MADVSVKMGVSGISQFKQGMSDAQASVKTLDAALKANEKQFQKTGDAENHMAAQTNLLNAKLQAQQNIVKNAEQALKQMEANGVRTSSKAYQDMQRKLIEAQSAMLDTQNEMEDLGTKAEDASGKTDKLAQSLGGINKKISLEQVIGAVNSITTGLENAAKKAVQLGEDLWNSIMDSARWADDTATMAQMYGIDLDTFMRMQKLVTNGLDTTVDAILTSHSKLNKGIGKESKDTMAVLDELGVKVKQLKGDEGAGEFISRDQTEVFWEAGQALMSMSDAYDKEAAAQALFGKSWKELIPLFSQFKTLDEYEDALGKVNVNSEETVEDLATLNDKISELKGNFETLKTEVIGSLAPALTGAADALNGLLTKVLEYLQTPEGKQALEDMGKAVEGLFSDLSSIDPDKVVEGVAGVIKGVTDGIQWLVDNAETVKGILSAIVIAWGASNVAVAGLEIAKLVNGIAGLGAASGAAAGASWGGAFASAVLAAAPWLIGLYTLLRVENTGDETGNNTLIDEKGNLTPEAKEYGYELTENGDVSRRAIVEKAAQDAWDLYRNGQFDAAALEALREKVLDNNAFADLVKQFYGKVQEDGDWKNLEDIDLTEWLKQFDGAPVEVEPVAPENAAESLTEQIGTVYIPIKYEPTGKIRTPQGWVYPENEHANGLWSVPFDGYPAILHKGERVVPAREVSNSRNFSSNLYVESMYMNNGTDAEGLAAAIAARNRRVMKGYGSC